MNARKKYRSSLTYEKWKQYVSEVQENIDLENALIEKGFGVLTSGRVDWCAVAKKEVCNFNDSLEASENILKLIERYKLTGSIVIVWTDANLLPISTEVEFFENIGRDVCSEDWDFWILPMTSNWLIEMYHEGEICFSYGNKLGE